MNTFSGLMSLGMLFDIIALLFVVYLGISLVGDKNYGAAVLCFIIFWMICRTNAAEVRAAKAQRDMLEATQIAAQKCDDYSSLLRELYEKIELATRESGRGGK